MHQFHWTWIEYQFHRNPTIIQLEWDLKSTWYSINQSKKTWLSDFLRNRKRELVAVLCSVCSVYQFQSIELFFLNFMFYQKWVIKKKRFLNIEHFFVFYISTSILQWDKWHRDSSRKRKKNEAHHHHLLIGCRSNDVTCDRTVTSVITQTHTHTYT